MLSNLTNGFVTVNVLDVGGTATYTCNTGYGLVGSSTRNCLQFGMWSGNEPACNSEFVNY